MKQKFYKPELTQAMPCLFKKYLVYLILDIAFSLY